MVPAILRGGRMSSVLISGASGFIGSHLKRRIPRAVTASARSDFHSLFEKHCITHVYHLAAAGVRGGEELPEAAIECNITGTFQLARMALQRRVRRFVYVGSGFEYRPQSQPVSESAPVAPPNLYGATKAAGWMLLDYLRREEGLPLVTLRPFAVYGPGEHASKLIPYVASKALRRQPMQLTGGEQVRDYIYVDDVVDALIAAGERDVCVGRVYNLGGGAANARPVRAIVEQILSLAGAPLSLCEFGRAERKRHEPEYLVADPSRAAAEFGWSAHTGWDEGLRATLASFA